MSTRSLTQNQTQSTPDFTPVQTGILQRKCACGKSAAGFTGKCSESEGKRLTLQKKSLGNEEESAEVPQIVHEVLRSPVAKIQRKLKIGAPNDKYEQEADRIADQIMRMPEPSIQRLIKTGEKEEEKTLQAKPNVSQIAPLIQRQVEPEEEGKEFQSQELPGLTPIITPQTQARINALRTGGQSLPESIRAFYEPRFGMDFSNVRIHTSSEAAQAAHDLQARAFTNGWNIVFAKGEYEPYTLNGRKLLAHELTHTLQQNKTITPSPAEPNINGTNTNQINETIRTSLEPFQTMGLGKNQETPQAEISNIPISTPPRKQNISPLKASQKIGRSLIHDPVNISPHLTAVSTGVIQREISTEPSLLLEEANESDEPDVTQVADRVDRVIVSCEKMLIGFETSGAVYVYRLTDCNETVSKGIYQTQVKIDEKKHSVRFTNLTKSSPESEKYETTESEEIKNAATTLTDNETEGGLDDDSGSVDFEFGWEIKPGQIDPIILLKDQDVVLVAYHGRIPSITEHRQECLLTKSPTTVIPEQPPVKKDITQVLPIKEIDLEFDLVKFGLADLSLRLAADLEASVNWSYGPGVIDQICLSRIKGKNHYVGRAHFDFPGSINLHVGLNGVLEIAVELAELIDILSLSGELDIDITGLLEGKVDTFLEVGFNSEESKSPWSLDTSIEMTGLTGLDFAVGTGLALDVLGFPIWEIHDPSTFERNWGYLWTGGFVFGKNFLPELNFGSIQEAQTADVKVAAKKIGKKSKKKPRSKSIPITKIVRHWLANSDVNADGLSCDTALPIQWFKPLDLYPSKLDFDPKKHPGVYPTSVNRDDGPTHVSHSAGFDNIGVVPDNWPTGDWAKCFQFIPGDEARRQSASLRRLLEKLGYDVTPVQIDHIRELQFGGKDRFDNLWPMDKSANESAGSLHNKQFAAYKKIFKNINGRYFFLNAISLTPPFE
ncbi:MAG: DUF4157 domain-containing protein [Cyanobacteria bacterium P01_D01_bin.116]